MPHVRLEVARSAFHAAVEDALQNGLLKGDVFCDALWDPSDAPQSETPNDKFAGLDVLQREKIFVLREQFEHLLRRNMLAQLEQVTHAFGCEKALHANDEARAVAAAVAVIGGSMTRVGIDEQSMHSLRSELDAAAARASVEALRGAFHSEQVLLDEQRERTAQAREEFELNRSLLYQIVEAAANAVQGSAKSHAK